MTTFFNPILNEFHWSATLTSLIFALRTAESGAMAPLIGFLTDRFGPRMVMLAGNAICGIGFILMGQIQSLLHLYLAALVLALGASGAFGLVGMTAVANWFERKRSLALGILVSGVGAAGAIVPLIHWVIQNYGWRNAFVLAGLSMWTVGIPLSFMVRDAPEKYGLLPDGDERVAPEHDQIEALSVGTSANGENETRSVQIHSFTPVQVLHFRSFWLISASLALSMACFHAIVAFNYPYLTDIGISAEIAGLAVFSLTAISVLGRLGFGWLGDVLDKRRVLAMTFALQFIGGICFGLAYRPWHLIPFLVAFAPAYGGQVPLRPAIQADFFGRHAFGSIQGIMVILMTVVGVFSPIFTAWIFDTWGSYRAAFLILSTGNLVAVPMILAARKPSVN
jgi:MFS family permease